MAYDGLMTMPESDGPGRSSQLFEARLAEYGSVREELISAISNQHLALTFGTASIIGVLVAGLLTWEQPAGSGVFFAVPLISLWVLAMWLAEVVRMLRAVEFCREQAVAINELVDPGGAEAQPPIRWESWRDQEPRRTFPWSYVSVVAALSISYVSGAVLGLASAGWSLLAILAVGMVFVALLLVALTAVARLYVQWAGEPARVGMPEGKISQVARWLGLSALGD